MPEICGLFRQIRLRICLDLNLISLLKVMEKIWKMVMSIENIFQHDLSIVSVLALKVLKFCQVFRLI